MTPVQTLQTMERTLTLETCALKATSRQWNRLSPEVQRMISMRTLFVHRTAPLIKDLTFQYLDISMHVVECPGAQYFTVIDDGRCRRFRHRIFDLWDFGDTEYDRYQIDSDQQSGITLGRVAGTERWGHELGA